MTFLGCSKWDRRTTRVKGLRKLLFIGVAA
jgi:hypothetical protein